MKENGKEVNKLKNKKEKNEKTKSEKINPKSQDLC
jgi:hypothetical protein